VWWLSWIELGVGFVELPKKRAWIISDLPNGGLFKKSLKK
jgi:hypothetical protein